MARMELPLQKPQLVLAGLFGEGNENLVGHRGIYPFGEFCSYAKLSPTLPAPQPSCGAGKAALPFRNRIQRG